MKKTVGILTTLLLFAMCCSAFAGTKEVLTSLEELKAAARSVVSKSDFKNQLAKTDTQINIAKRDKSVSKAFIQAATNAKAYYYMSYTYEGLKAADDADKSYAEGNRYLDQAYSLTK
jgi:hypothetical protein